MCAATANLVSRERSPDNRRAFSLIEVVLALGVLAFAILTILALLPMGLQSNRDSYEESVGTNLVGAIIADWRSLQVGKTNASVSAVFQLPRFSQSMPLSNSLYLTEAGQLTNSAVAARYRVSYTVTPPSSLNAFAPYYVSFVVTWPAVATNPVSSVESIASIPAQ